MKPWLKRVALVGALTLAVFAYTLLLWRGPWWIDGDHLRTRDLQPADGVVITGVRTALVALGAGGIAALGLYYTHQTLQQTRKRDAEQARATIEGQINDRYVEAVKLLADKESLTQRLGGIYALERNMHDSQRDYPTVIAILSAFIRSSLPADPSALTRTPDEAEMFTSKRPDQAVQAALDVIGRRPAPDSSARPDLSSVNLKGTRLKGARLHMVDLIDADLTFTDLSDADLSGADLTHADLVGAVLHHANLEHADLSGTSLDKAHLLGANLNYADFNGTSLADTDLSWASLVGADLSNADLLRTNFTGADLTGAILGEDLTGLGLKGLDLTGTAGTSRHREPGRTERTIPAASAPAQAS